MNTDRTVAVFHSLLKAGVEAIPIVGGSLNSLASDYLQERHQKRLLEFINEFKAAVEQRMTAVEHSIKDMDGFLDVFEATVLRIVHERRKEKRRALKNILVATVESGANNLDDSEYFVGLVDRLSVSHFVVLSQMRRFVVDTHTANEKSTSRLLEITMRSKLDNEEKVLELIQDLENENLSQGFLSHLQTRDGKGGLFLHVTSYVTDKGSRLLGFVSEDGDGDV